MPRAPLPKNYAALVQGGTQYGIPIADWSNGTTSSAGTSAKTLADLAPGAINNCVLTQTATPSHLQVSATGATVPIRSLAALGVWVKNPQARGLNFQLQVFNVGGGREATFNMAIGPSQGWTYVYTIVQHASSNTLLATDSIQNVRVLQRQIGATQYDYQNWIAGDQLMFGPVYLNPRSRPKFLLMMDDGMVSIDAHGSGNPTSDPTGYPVSGINYKAICDYYGFKASLGISTGLVGSATKYMSWDRIRTLADAGWGIANHSASHPANADTGGLRLLGPFGYYLSSQLTAGLGATNRHAISSVAATGVITFSADPRFIDGMPITFTDSAPTGLAVGTTYYVKGYSAATSRLTTDAAGTTYVTLVADWSGTANYRYSGSEPNDTAIYAELVSADSVLNAQGLGSKHFVLPQGAWDTWVETACRRMGFKVIRGLALYNYPAAAIPVGNFAGGGGVIGSNNLISGWMNLVSCVQVDAATTPTIDNIKSYIDEVIRVGGTGSCYTHDITTTIAVRFDAMCAYLLLKQRQGVIDIVTLDQWWDGLTQPRAIV